MIFFFFFVSAILYASYSLFAGSSSDVLYWLQYWHVFMCSGTIRCYIPKMGNNYNKNTEEFWKLFFFLNEHAALFVLQIFELKYYEGTNRFIALGGLSQDWVCNCYLIRTVDAIISLPPLNSEHEGSSCSARLITVRLPSKPT